MTHNTYHTSEDNERIFNRCQIEWMTFLTPHQYCLLDYLLFRSNLDGWLFHIREISTSTRLSTTTVQKLLKTFDFIEKHGTGRNMKITLNRKTFNKWLKFKMDCVKSDTIKSDCVKSDTIDRVNGDTMIVSDLTRTSISTSSTSTINAYKCLKEYNSLNNNNRSNSTISLVSPVSREVIGEKNKSGCMNSISSKSISTSFKNTETTKDNILSGHSQDRSGIESNLKKLWKQFNKVSEAQPVNHLHQESKQDMNDAKPQSGGVKCPIPWSNIAAKVESSRQPDRQVLPTAEIKKVGPGVVTIPPVVSPVEVTVSLDELKESRAQLLTEIAMSRKEMTAGLSATEMKYRYLRHEELSKQVVAIESKIRIMSPSPKTTDEQLNEFDLIFKT